MVTAANLSNVGRLIFFSSDFAIDPKGEYGRSKLRSEELVKNLFIGTWTIIRASPIWVTNEPAGNSTIFKLVKKVKNSSFIFLPDGGKFTLSPIFINDLIRNLGKLLDEKIFFSETINFDGEAIVLFDVLSLIAKKYDVKLRVIHFLLGILNF